MELISAVFDEKWRRRTWQSCAPYNNNVDQNFSLRKQRLVLPRFNNTEISTHCNYSHGTEGNNRKCVSSKPLKMADSFTKLPTADKESCNCKRHAAGGHQNITHSQCYDEHIWRRTEPVVSVHGITCEKIAKESQYIDNRKQNCFSPN